MLLLNKQYLSGQFEADLEHLETFSALQWLQRKWIEHQKGPEERMLSILSVGRIFKWAKQCIQSTMNSKIKLSSLSEIWVFNGLKSVN
jgi:hypothetical protein